MVEVVRELWTLSGPTTLLKEGHLQPVAQDCIRAASESLQGWRLHVLSRQPEPVLNHSHRKEAFPDVQREPSVFQFVPPASSPATGHHCKEPSSLIFIPSMRCSCKSKISPWAFPSPGWTDPALSDFPHMKNTPNHESTVLIVSKETEKFPPGLKLPLYRDLRYSKIKALGVWINMD